MGESMCTLGTIEIKLSPEIAEFIENAVEKALNKQIQSGNKESELELLSTQELSERLKVSLPTIHKWKKAGKIPFRKISQKLYFNYQEVIKRIPQYQLKRR
jgi:excisionase family DNA binding protein